MCSPQASCLHLTSEKLWSCCFKFQGFSAQAAICTSRIHPCLSDFLRLSPSVSLSFSLNSYSPTLLPVSLHCVSHRPLLSLLFLFEAREISMNSHLFPTFMISFQTLNKSILVKRVNKNTNALNTQLCMHAKTPLPFITTLTVSRWLSEHNGWILCIQTLMTN